MNPELVNDRTSSVFGKVQLGYALVDSQRLERQPHVLQPERHLEAISGLLLVGDE